MAEQDTQQVAVAAHPSGMAQWGGAAHDRRRRFRLPISAAHQLNLKLGQWFPRAFPFVYVIGYPKSGTSWASQLIADGLYLPYPQHSVIPFGFATVLQTHARFSDAYPRSVYMMRDGRDVIVSLYFHLVANRKACADTARRYRGIPGLGDADEIRQNLPEFIRGQARRPFSTPANWGDHVRSYFLQSSQKSPLLRYEDLRTRGAETLSTTLTALTGGSVSDAVVASSLERYSFTRLSGRKSGKEDRGSYLRKGEIGDWRNHFTPAAAEAFLKHFGDALVLAGYEQDEQWARRLESQRAAA